MAMFGDAAAEKVFSSVLKKVKPSPSEIKSTTEKVNSLMLLLKSIVPEDVELLVAGSIARGTNLNGSSDIDIFLLFKKNLKRDNIVKLGLEYGKKVVDKEKGRYEIKYAEHPYIRLYLDSIGIKADLVPALKIDNIEEMGTTVDRTPLHNEFVNSHLSTKQRDDVRVLKYMLKCHGIYGAEVKTNGFSGYLCELMIHHYGSLLNFLKASQRFRLPLVIEPKIKKESSNAETAKKFNSQFVVIDPVDSDRNVAAGVSTESLSRLVLMGSGFLSKPEIKVPAVESEEDAVKGMIKFSKSTGLDVFTVMAKVPNKSEDVVYPQLRKMNHQIAAHVMKSGFSVYMTAQTMHDGTGFLMIIAPKQELGSRLLKGPDAFIGGASASFMKKHKNAIGMTVEGTSLYALEKSKYRSIEDVLGDLPKNLVRHKDIDLRNAKILVNTVPKGYASQIHATLKGRLTI